MPIVVEPTQWIMRFYKNNHCADSMDDYVAVCNIIRTGLRSAIICGLHGKFSQKHVSEIKLWARSEGITRLTWQRRNRDRTHTTKFTDKEFKF